MTVPPQSHADDNALDWTEIDNQAGRRGSDPTGIEIVPPQDLQAERAVLGGMLLTKDAIADVLEAKLKGEHYYRPAHELIHQAILHLYAKGEPADPITVADELLKRGELTRTGGASYLHTLVQSVPTAANAGYYAGPVLEAAALRRLREEAVRIVQNVDSRAGEPEEIVNEAGKAILAIAEQRATDTYASAGSDLQDALDWVEATGNRKAGQISGVPTGFADLDKLTDGLQPGQLIIIGGRPGMGKSTAALDIARTAAIKHGVPSAFFSLEMSRRELQLRLLSAEGRVALHHLRTGNTTDDDWGRIARVTGRISEAPTFIDDAAGLTMMEIRTKARRQAMSDTGLGLMVVDYLQLLKTGGRAAENRQQEVSDLSRNLKLLAKELEIPVIALSQLNRGPEARTEKKPGLSDLRESGAIEQDADIVILVHREDAYEKESPRAGEADLIVAKHRNGPTATITVAFQGHYSRFVDMTRDVT
ncbi:replicative DNA helicase [Streptomyces sp. MJM8645]|uniref:replicative DNA helicase n=1 Tax=Streptomyces sp. MJM8645 TaxID=1120523 RepID=UPI0007AF9AA8|nr:replicative DNA helicase [Streptomyces sp. MJM8645]